jgi:shikimate dehydrogenase
VTDRKRFAVLGDPIAHSKSPRMHAAAYRALDLPHTYEPIRATPDDLAGLVAQLRDGVFAGFNVTVPHKRRILDLVDRIDPRVEIVGAANTLVPERGADGLTIAAYNTDVPALAAELRRLAPERTDAEWRASRAVVIGAGGAGRSAIAALAIDLGVRDVVVRMRDPSALALGGLGGPGDWRDARFTAQPLAADATTDAGVLTVVQCTSAGMTGADPGEGVAAAVAWRDLPVRAVALDVVYAPPETPFLRAAREQGLRHANGFGMLAMQGALAFELWLGAPAPYNAMLSALV